MKLRGIGLACLLLVRATTVGAQCPEPSAIDLNENAAPLLVSKAARGDLQLNWEDVGVGDYLVHAGAIDALTDRAHLPVAVESEPMSILPMRSLNEYYLVTASCESEGSSAGRDGDGVERPAAGLVLVHVSVEGSGIFGTSIDLDHPASLSFATELDAFLGPFAVAGVLQIFSGPLAGHSSALATFSSFDPDPSFDAVPGMAVEVLRLGLASYVGLPTADTIQLSGCEVSDDFGDPVLFGACLLSPVRILP